MEICFNINFTTIYSQSIIDGLIFPRGHSAIFDLNSS